MIGCDHVHLLREIFVQFVGFQRGGRPLTGTNTWFVDEHGNPSGMGMPPGTRLLGASKQKKKSKTKTAPKNKRGGGGSNRSDQEARGYFMNDLDWSVCDKDCGWCGRCMYGLL